MEYKKKSKELATLDDVKNILSSLNRELTYEQQLALKYSSRFSKLPREKVLELLKKLMDEFKLDEKIAYVLSEYLPKYEETIKAIIPKEYKLSDEEIKKIKEMIDDYR